MMEVGPCIQRIALALRACADLVDRVKATGIISQTSTLLNDIPESPEQIKARLRQEVENELLEEELQRALLMAAKDTQQHYNVSVAQVGPHFSRGDETARTAIFDVMIEVEMMKRLLENALARRMPLPEPRELTEKANTCKYEAQAVLDALRSRFAPPTTVPPTIPLPMTPPLTTSATAPVLGLPLRLASASAAPAFPEIPLPVRSTQRSTLPASYGSVVVNYGRLPPRADSLLQQAFGSTPPPISSEPRAGASSKNISGFGHGQYNLQQTNHPPYGPSSSTPPTIFSSHTREENHSGPIKTDGNPCFMYKENNRESSLLSTANPSSGVRSDSSSFTSGEVLEPKSSSSYTRPTSHASSQYYAPLQQPQTRASITSITSENSSTASIVGGKPSPPTIETAAVKPHKRPSIFSRNKSKKSDRSSTTAIDQSVPKGSNGNTGPLKGVPNKQNDYWGFCEQAWRNQEDLIRGLQLRYHLITQFTGRMAADLECRKSNCTFVGRQWPPGDKKVQVDPTIYTATCGIRYRWAWLAKSHRPCRTENEVPWKCEITTPAGVRRAQEEQEIARRRIVALGCLFCVSGGTATAEYTGVEALMDHILEEHGPTETRTVREDIGKKLNCVLGSVPMDEAFDINIPMAVMPVKQEMGEKFEMYTEREVVELDSACVAWPTTNGSVPYAPAAHAQAYLTNGDISLNGNGQQYHNVSVHHVNVEAKGGFSASPIRQSFSESPVLGNVRIWS